MDKDYYSILQINRNASPEIIEKAYKTLVKKYHPDLQQSEESKKEAEEVLKNINEAYEVLSDKDKKQKYDSTLYDNTISKEDFNKLYEQNQILKNKINNLQNNYNINHLSNSNIDKQNISYEKKSKKDYELKEKQQDLEFKKQIEQAKRQAYYDAYIQDLKNRGYTIKYKGTSYTVVKQGDVNGDGKLTPADSTVVLRAYVGLDSISNAEKSAADTNKDGKLTPADSTVILRTYVGLENLEI